MNWETAYSNTKSFEVSHRLLQSTSHLQGCKNCNSVVRVSGNFGGQQIGNCYQTLTACAQCGHGLIIDNDKFRLIDIYLN